MFLFYTNMGHLSHFTKIERMAHVQNKDYFTRLNLYNDLTLLKDYSALDSRGSGDLAAVPLP